MIPDNDSFVVNSVIKPNLKTGPWIAGGAAMCWFNGSNTISGNNFPLMQDIDVFFANVDQLTKVTQRIMEYNSCSILSPYETSNAKTYQFELNGQRDYWKIQLIQRTFFNSAEEVLNNFDFVCCGIATDGEQYVTLPNAAKDLKEKVLNIHRYNPLTVLPRTIKYWAYGFTPSPELINLIGSDTLLTTNFAGHTDYDHAF